MNEKELLEKITMYQDLIIELDTQRADYKQSLDSLIREYKIIQEGKQGKLNLTE